MSDGVIIVGESDLGKPRMIQTPLVAFWTAAVASGLLSAGIVQAEDWPRWRGPRGDGTWNGPALPEKWPAEGLKRLWSVPIGGGYAGISVANGRVFTLDRQPSPKGQAVAASGGPANGYERIFCLDAATGKLLWEHKYPTKYPQFGGYDNGPRAAPTVHDDKVYSLGAVGHVFCLEAETGKVVWSKDMVRDFHTEVPEWGLAASPVVDGDRVLIHAGAQRDGSVIAFHRLTGKEIWRALPDPAGYATPILIDSPGGRQLVVWTPLMVRGLDPRTGRVFWSVPFISTYGVAIATPIFHDHIVFATGYWEGARAIRLGGTKFEAKLVWENNRHLRGLLAQPLFRDGCVYSIDKTEGLVCCDWKTGKKKWDDGNRMTPRGQNPHAAMIWLNDQDRALVLNSQGELIQARFRPTGYEELSRTKLVNGKVWSHPAFAGHHVFIRTDGAEQATKDGALELACFALTQPEKSK